MKMANANWGRPEKIRAREETIIKKYQEYFGSFLCSDKHYWTMCGRCVAEDGNLIRNCELDHLLKNDFIKADQFHGVEILPEIHELNALYKDANWYVGDLYFSILNNIDNFSPGVINIDTNRMPRTAIAGVSNILSLLSEKTSEVMVIANFVMVNPNNHTIKSDIYKIVKLLEENQNYQHAINTTEWILHPNYYCYGGGEKENTPMVSIIWVRKD